MDIKVNGVVFRPTEARFSLVLENPMLNWSVVPGSKIYDVSLNSSPELSAALGNVQHPSVRAENIVYVTEIVRGNVTVEKGFSVVKDAKNGFSLGFTSNYSEIFGQNQSKLLRDIDFGTVAFGSTEINGSLTNTYNSGGWVMPTIDNSKFYENGNAPGGWAGLVNAYSGSFVTTGPCVPMFFAKNILNRITAITGVTFSGSFFDSSLFNNLLLYNMAAAVVGVDTEVRLHLPKLTIAQMIMGWRKCFNILVRIDSSKRNVRMDWADDLYKAVPERNWSDKFARIKSGTPTWTDGIKIKAQTDSGDGLSKSDYFIEYQSAASTGLGYVEIETVFTGIPMDGGLPKVEQVGVNELQTDKDYGNRLLYWIGGATPEATDEYNSVSLDSTSRANGYFANLESFYKSGFKVEEMASLTAIDIAQMSAIFRGEVAEAPIVHVWGNNYLIENITVPDVEGEASKVVMWRV